MNRRGLLGGILLAGLAPAVARAGSLMPLWTPLLVLYGDGIHDDHPALVGWLSGRRVLDLDGRPLGRLIQGKRLRMSEQVVVHQPDPGEFHIHHCSLYMGKEWPKPHMTESFHVTRFSL